MANVEQIKAATTTVMVLCGAPSQKDVMMYGDFVGTYRELENTNITGYFWSVVDLANVIKRTGKPIYSGHGKERKMVLSQFEADHREKFYEVKELDQMKADFLLWLKTQASERTYGDKVDIVLIAHGAPGTGSLQLGRKMLSVRDFTNALMQFRQSVQVNVFVSACYSGHITENIAIMNTEQLSKSQMVHVACDKGEKGYGIRTISGSYRNTYFGDAVISNLRSITSKKGKLFENLPKLAQI